MAETEKHRDKHIAIDRMKERDKGNTEKMRMIQAEREREKEVKINTERQKQRGQNKSGHKVIQKGTKRGALLQSSI